MGSVEPDTEWRGRTAAGDRCSYLSGPQRGAGISGRYHCRDVSCSPPVLPASAQVEGGGWKVWGWKVGEEVEGGRGEGGVAVFAITYTC